MTDKEIKTLENNAFVHADMAMFCMKEGNPLQAALYLGRYFAETEMLGMDHEYETISDILFEKMVENAGSVFKQLFRADYVVRP